MPTTGKIIRVLIVDDSLFFRTSLERALKKNSNIEIAGLAVDADDALEKIRRLRPDVVSLDVEMPKMNGIDFLKKLLPIYRVPVVVVSAAPVKVFDALSAGAVDFVRKPELRSPSDFANFADDLAEKIKAASMAKVRLPAALAATASAAAAAAPRPAATPAAPAAPAAAAPKLPVMGAPPRPAGAPAIQRPLPPFAGPRNPNAVIAIGASTGGTEATIAVVKNLPANMPGIVIVQHMPAVFTSMYAQRLNRICNMRAVEAKDMERVEQGKIIIGAGDFHLRLARDAQGYYVTSRPGEKVSGHCPSVDVLFDSVASAAGANAVGVILTGMGSDGAEGLLKMRRRGAYTIGQDQETCVVYGMPCVAYEKGAVQKQLPLDAITAELVSYVGSH